MKLFATTMADAGLSLAVQFEAILLEMTVREGELTMKEIYGVIESKMNDLGYTLSEQGKATLRTNVNREAVERGLIEPFDRRRPGWRATPAGTNFVQHLVPSRTGGSQVAEALLITDMPETSTPWEDSGSVLLEGSLVFRASEEPERNAQARRVCLELHGTACKVCSIEFVNVYGEIGKGFIHVHHLRPMKDATSVREVDPKSDLIPVCPNCHAMLHAKEPPLTVSELQDLMSCFRS